MKILKIDQENPDPETIEKAAKVIEVGGIVVYPTDTLYGLGANPFNQQALLRLFEIKQRDFGKPVSLAFKDLRQVEKFAIVTPTARKIIQKFLPGALTLLLPSKFDLALLGGEKIGVRIPRNKVVDELLSRLKYPITATSANISGGKDPASVEEVLNQLGASVDLILDGGKCELGKPSTILDLTQDKVEIVREGAIPFAEIKKLLDLS